MQKYSNMSGTSAKRNAQLNLQGRTHYADDQTLRYHHARILNARPVAGGLLFAIVEGVALDYQNTTRGFRHVIFDLWGHVVSTGRDLEKAHKTADAARKALETELGTIDALKICYDGIARARRAFDYDIEETHKLMKAANGADHNID